MDLSRFSQVLISLSAITVVSLLLIGYWHFDATHPSTEDAYVKAHILHVAPEIMGKVVRVAVQDNTHVKQGDLLFQIDDKPFAIELNRAQAKVAIARQEASASSHSVAESHANRQRALSELRLAEKDFARTQILVRQGQDSAAHFDVMRTKLETAKANVTFAENHSKLEQAKLGNLGDDNANVKQALAELEQAKWNYDHTTVRAAAPGIVSHLELRAGDLVSPNAAALSIIEDGSWWIEANFKETQIQNIHAGQTVDIQLDMYPEKHFQGVVKNIARGSGSAFSLLPPENASGNWVKVTQRFPVLIDFAQTVDRPLLLGASASIQVNTNT